MTKSLESDHSDIISLRIESKNLPSFPSEVKNDELTDDLKRAREKIKSLQNDIKYSKTDLDNNSKLNNELNLKLNRLQNSIDLAESEKKGYIQGNEKIERRLREKEDETIRLNEELRRLQMEREVYNRTESDNVKELAAKLNSVKAQLEQAHHKNSHLEAQQQAREKNKKEQIEERDKRIKDLEEKINEIRGDKSQADSKVFYERGWNNIISMNILWCIMRENS